MPKNIEGSTFPCDGETLWRSVEPTRTDRGQQPYRHSCSKATFERICHDVEALNGARFSGQAIGEAGDYPLSQLATALAFLEERGIIEQSGRTRIAQTDSVYLDGMTEFHALYEETTDLPIVRVEA